VRFEHVDFFHIIDLFTATGSYSDQPLTCNAVRYRK